MRPGLATVIVLCFVVAVSSALAGSGCDGFTQAARSTSPAGSRGGPAQAAKTTARRASERRRR